MLLKIKTLTLLTGLSIISSGCQTVPEQLSEYKWAYCEVIPTDNEPWACLKKEDVKKLRQELHECRTKSQ